jgi:hypothetical protein
VLRVGGEFLKLSEAEFALVKNSAPRSRKSVLRYENEKKKEAEAEAEEGKKEKKRRRREDSSSSDETHFRKKQEKKLQEVSA